MIHEATRMLCAYVVETFNYLYNYIGAKTTPNLTDDNLNQMKNLVKHTVALTVRNNTQIIAIPLTVQYLKHMCVCTCICIARCMHVHPDLLATANLFHCAREAKLTRLEMLL